MLEAAGEESVLIASESPEVRRLFLTVVPETLKTVGLKTGVLCMQSKCSITPSISLQGFLPTPLPSFIMPRGAWLPL